MNLKTLRKLTLNRKVEDLTKSRINAFLKNQYNQPIDYVQQPSHNASSIGTNCFRKIYYQYYKVTKDSGIDAKGAKIFELGKYVEQMVMSWFKGLGEHIAYKNKGNGEIPKDRFTGLPDPQFPIESKEWRVRKGFIDNVAIVDGDLWLYEIKSSGSAKFMGLEEPLAEHLDQTAVYFKAFNEMLANGEYDHIKELKGFKKAKGVKVVYLNKDNSDLKIFSLGEIHVERHIEKLNRKIEKANQYIDLKRLPEKTPHFCNYCAWQKKCKKDFNLV